jgi:2-C-methyl-D-erythritol 4-phosphate cytidylyltransferase
MSDTVKEVVEGKLRRTVPRETLVQLIGPWIFERETLAEALARIGGAAEINDMIGLCQAARLHVRTLPVQ